LVTVDNVGEYVSLCVRGLLMDGVAAQMRAVVRGFSEVFPPASLAMFAPTEVRFAIQCSLRNFS
jgi:hypothetical protein